MLHKRPTFVMLDNAIVNLSSINRIGKIDLKKQTIVVVVNHYDWEVNYTVTGFAAMELLWLVKAGYLEGHNLKLWPKHAWAIHNLIAHPLMQLLAFFRLYKWALWIHDVTVPKPMEGNNNDGISSTNSR